MPMEIFLAHPVKETKKQFDVILIDSTDPEEGGPSSVLFQKQFYSDCKSCLAPGQFPPPFLGPFLVKPVVPDTDCFLRWNCHYSKWSPTLGKLSSCCFN